MNMKLPNLLRTLFSVGALTSIGLFAGCGGTDGPIRADVPGAPTGGATDKLRTGDMIKVVFSNLSSTPAPLPQEEQIKEDGTITLPLVGAVTAAGKGTGELQNELQKAYAKYYVSMNVTVLSSQRFYSVGGEVKIPKREEYVGDTTVIKAIQAAGDVTDFAKRTKVQLTRANGKKFIINYDKALRDSRLDLPVYPGDYIWVPRRLL